LKVWIKANSLCLVRFDHAGGGERKYQRLNKTCRKHYSSIKCIQ